MKQILQYKKFDAVIIIGLIALWLAAFKSSALFSFFGTNSSLWFLPAGITLSIAIAVPLRFIIAPLIANWLLAVPLVSALLHVEYTSVADHLLHGTRLFLVYAGAGCVLRYGFKIKFPVSNLSDQLKVISVTLLASLLGAASGVSLHVAMGSFDWEVAKNIALPWMIGDGIAAVIVPPLLVPLLLRLFADDQSQVKTTRYLSSIPMLLYQLVTIVCVMYVAFGISTKSSGLVELWYLVVLPPIIFAVRGGIINAASSIAITALLTPPVATLLGFDGERISLQILLLIGGVVSLVIGGAVTDRDNAFKIIKRHEEELEQLVVNRTRMLEEAHEFQKHLIRSIGHDMQQPVFALNNVISTFKYAIKDPELSQMVKEAETLSGTALRFIRKTLDYAKREAGQVVVSKQEFPVQKVFDQIKSMFDEDANERGIILDIQASDLMLNSDEHLVWETLSNLVQNAIRMSVENQTVVVTAFEVDGQLTISVSDQHEGPINQDGAAGFGLEIVTQISKLLNFEFELSPNLAKISFK